MDRGMIICPSCDVENITGADNCEQCGQALSDQNLPTPATYVERCMVRDRLERAASVPGRSLGGSRRPRSVTSSKLLARTIDRVRARSPRASASWGSSANGTCCSNSTRKWRSSWISPVSEFMTPRSPVARQRSQSGLRHPSDAYRRISPPADHRRARTVRSPWCRCATCSRYLTEKMYERGTPPRRDHS